MRLINNVLIGLAVASSSLSVNAYALSPFVVNAIHIQGLHGIPQATVFHYLPIKVGQVLDDNKSAEILQSLYSTGFFEDVNLSRMGNTLVVNVIERGAMGAVHVTGNSKLETKDIQTMLKSLHITSGNMLDRANLEAFKEEVLQKYREMGRYNASVNITTTQETHNRMNVQVVINEGNVAKVRTIKIIGNTAFSTKTLTKQFVMTTPRLWTFFTKTDQYSRPKFDASLENLQSYYLDHGYLHFKIISSDASLTPDRRGVDIVVTVAEGPRYSFSGHSFSGDLLLPPNELEKLITFKPGDVFSRKKVIDANDAIGVALGDKGYAFAQVEPMPTVNEQTREVYINFNITPGQKVYVRRITFSGNTVTADRVLRRAMLQQEGSLIAVSSIRESVRQLNLMGFFKDVQVKTTPVPGTTNQVDVNYQVKETPAGQASLNLGWGTLGLELGAGLNQPNFLGTGKTVGVNFSRSRYTSSYSINYYNPYYTVNNIGRGFNFYYQKTSPKALSNGSLYTFDTYGASVLYSIPLSLNDRLQVGAALNNISLNVGKDIFGQFAASHEIVSFINHNGMNFNQLLLTASWSHVGQDRSIYPTQGFDDALSGEISVPVSHKLKYYKTGYGAEYYLPLNQAHSFIFLLTGHLGYGNSYGYHPLPFFENYYAGGLTLGQVRGYETSSLGPHDSFGNAIGGNLLTAGSVALIFPTGISDSLRTSVFIDGGNVFQTVNHADTFGSGPIRYSAGLGIEWRSPVGPLSFSIADPLHKQKAPSIVSIANAIGRINPLYVFIPNYLNTIRNNLGDKADYFQFTMGTTF